MGIPKEELLTKEVATEPDVGRIERAVAEVNGREYIPSKVDVSHWKLGAKSTWLLLGMQGMDSDFHVK